MSESQLDRRLEELRKAKRNNIADLEAILQQDVNRMKKIPLYFWLLLFSHFLLMLEGWRHQRGLQFLLNFAMLLWLQRKIYREIIMSLAIPIGLVILLFTLIGA